MKQYRIFNNIVVNYSTAPLKSPLLKEKLISMQNNISDVMKWYENLTGLDEIRMAQNKVIEVQERFATAQEKRRGVTLELNDLKNKIKDIQEELVSTPRGDERYITLITKEHKLLKEEIRLTDIFNIFEREERELFTTLTNAVKDSHERERIHTNKTKYISIIGSVVGALIGIAGSAINNRSKISEMKKMVSQTTEDSRRELLVVCSKLERIVGSHLLVKNDEEIKNNLRSISESLNTLKSHALEFRISQDTITTKEEEKTGNEMWLNSIIYALSIYILYKIFF